MKLHRRSKNQGVLIVRRIKIIKKKRFDPNFKYYFCLFIIDLRIIIKFYALSQFLNPSYLYILILTKRLPSKMNYFLDC